jgi:hypothetical protein
VIESFLMLMLFRLLRQARTIYLAAIPLMDGISGGWKVRIDPCTCQKKLMGLRHDDTRTLFPPRTPDLLPVLQCLSELYSRL